MFLVSLILGMFGGDRSLIGRLQRDQFSGLGIAHVLAVSGYHVGLVAGIFFAALATPKPMGEAAQCSRYPACLVVRVCNGDFPFCDPGSVHVDSCMGQLGFRVEGECMASLGHCRLLGLGMGSDGAKSTRNATQLCCHGRVDWLEESAMVERACRCTMGHDSLVAGSVWRIPALFWPVNVAMGPWLMGFAVLAGLGLVWEPCIHSFLEAWVRGLDACLEVLWGQWPDQRVGFWMLSWDKRHVVLVCGACWESNGDLKGFAEGWW